MRKLLFAPVLFIAAGVTAYGQDHETVIEPTDSRTMLAPLETTPEMWFYEQEQRRADDPRQAVRRKAEFRSVQRQRRLAAMKWFGVSNARPTVNPTPFMGPYGHAWVSNTHSPMWWSGQSSAPLVLAPRRSSYGLW